MRLLSASTVDIVVSLLIACLEIHATYLIHTIVNVFQTLLPITPAIVSATGKASVVTLAHTAIVNHFDSVSSLHWIQPDVVN